MAEVLCTVTQMSRTNVQLYQVILTKPDREAEVLHFLGAASFNLGPQPDANRVTDLSTSLEQMLLGSR